MTILWPLYPFRVRDRPPALGDGFLSGACVPGSVLTRSHIGVEGNLKWSEELYVPTSAELQVFRHLYQDESAEHPPWHRIQADIVRSGTSELASLASLQAPAVLALLERQVPGLVIAIDVLLTWIGGSDGIPIGGETEFLRLDREVYTETYRMELTSELPKAHGGDDPIIRYLGKTNLPGAQTTGGYHIAYSDRWKNDLMALRELALKIQKHKERSAPANDDADGSSKAKQRDRDKNLESRDKWIYDECCKGTPYDLIVSKLKKKPKSWDRIESKQGIRSAAKRYADRNGLPQVPRRQDL